MITGLINVNLGFCLAVLYRNAKKKKIYKKSEKKPAKTSCTVTAAAIQFTVQQTSPAKVNQVSKYHCDVAITPSLHGMLAEEQNAQGI